MSLRVAPVSFATFCMAIKDIGLLVPFRLGHPTGRSSVNAFITAEQGVPRAGHDRTGGLLPIHHSNSFLLTFNGIIWEPNIATFLGSLEEVRLFVRGVGHPLGIGV
eukprot:CAMPEP_0172541212 /NCGR_PEP_ID=MMETSP1067-20121228/12056_1 /TAXON_ID=265564 ORGANISM="Thalassiosira punctigera, Strain Tpunct2005C2" /NCGR_SAMPLE_ID=MMETSP1067 /ASSEMBLY_ACC=CAM_ASM_000444 /LENGTH=105 /DNA_ID=CAMNT_0013327201 /DNA_START=17 /DNA_END=330 /DNA_ORIENTATION=+